MPEMKSSKPVPLANAVPPQTQVVGVGASAGGLEALTKLIAALPADGGMAYIFVQHLDPTHKSLMGELLGEHTAMPVIEAVDGAPIAANHVYVIPAGGFLAISGDVLRVSEPTEPHGARMPIDFLFAALARDRGNAAIAIVLSGTGTDGTVGARAIKAGGGLVLAQDPGEADYDGMPASVIAAGVADAVAKVAEMPAVLVKHRRSGAKSIVAAAPDTVLRDLIELLRKNTVHDFTLYKMGTLQRRIERRMALASIPANDMAKYLAIVANDPVELGLLANDLLINVTSFFRDPKVFDELAQTFIPGIVRAHTADTPLRIWIAGCSTGEETYSLAMLFAEAIAAQKRTIKLSVFASDVDPDAVAVARDGVYPESIASDVSPDRLARFFVKKDNGYAVVPDLRAAIVFTIQDLLADPPFSRLDFVSCRNLLIYLGPEAQAKAIALFHFALRPGGILLLGTSETIAHAEGRFETVAKAERIYRHIGKNRPDAFLFSTSEGDGPRVPPRAEAGRAAQRLPAFADLCRKLVLENFAPAAVLVNRAHQCLYSMGPTERYLRVAPGYPTHDLLAMATPGLRTKLRTAIDHVDAATPHHRTAGGPQRRGSDASAFDIDVRRVVHDGEELLLIGFIDRPGTLAEAANTASDAPRVDDLEQELEGVRTDLAAAIHDLEVSGEEHRAVNEEALSVNEEYQSANEELLTSKEELQSLNEELTALNSQLQETLERQRTTANDLQNVLYSTDVATLFLDPDLKIRFFTPATRALFNLIPGDVGRPLSDLHALSADPTLPDDARAVLDNRRAADREIEAPGSVWFLRRILPYRTDTDGIEGVVITFIDITERKLVRKALEHAKREADVANLAKSRFLAAASHDLRQPLQSLALLHGLLVKVAESERARALLGRLDQTVGTMSRMLDAMLDISQIDASVVTPKPLDFEIGALINRVRGEFMVQATAQGLSLCSVHCSRIVHTDAAMLEQMLRNLISNALKYTPHGKILIGCRPCGGQLRIEVWDTGLGIAPDQLDAIFEEYHQIDNPARAAGLGLGLGLSIVQRLGKLLGHPVAVRSIPGRGSVFSIVLPLPGRGGARAVVPPGPMPISTLSRRTGAILVVDDEPDVRDLLAQLLADEGHTWVSAIDGKSALAAIGRMQAPPELLLVDYNLPGPMTGLQLAQSARELLKSEVPAIVLTGDRSPETQRKIAAGNAVRLTKPVDPAVLATTIARLLLPVAATGDTEATIYVVDDDDAVRTDLRELLEADGRTVEDFSSCEAFLARYQPGGHGCLLIDAFLPGIDGIDLLRRLQAAGHRLPAIMITGSGAVPMAVEAMKVGAIDLIEKPLNCDDLRASIARALAISRDASHLHDWQAEAATHIAGLTRRQQQVMDLVLAGQPSKNIAADLHISQRTVENHRAAIMKKTGAKSLPALARLVLAAASPRPRA